jgi:hypothetical protein
MKYIVGISLLLALCVAVSATELLEIRNIPNPIYLAEKETLKLDLGQFYIAGEVEYNIKFPAESDAAKYASLLPKFKVEDIPNFKISKTLNISHFAKDETGQPLPEFGLITGNTTIELGKLNDLGNPELVSNFNLEPSSDKY